MPKPGGNVSGFRGRLFLIIVLVVGLLAIIGAALAQRHLSAASEEEFANSVQQHVEASLEAHQVRQEMLVGICADLARQPRIHAALEDDALDLLYPSAANELSPLMNGGQAQENEAVIRAGFYRFLDMRGKVIPPVQPRLHGLLPAGWEGFLELPGLPENPQTGIAFLPPADGAGEVVEIIAVPVISTETFSPIAALVVGFPLQKTAAAPGHFFGVWSKGSSLTRIPGNLSRPEIENRIASMISRGGEGDSGILRTGRGDFRLVVTPLNPDSAYPPAYGYFLSSMEPLQERLARLRRQVLFGALVVIVIGLAAAHLVARNMSRPVENLALASEEEYHQRLRAELALDATSQELERAARFSADASHQLKTPVAVMRAGLEELAVDRELPERLRPEVAALIGQTGRLTRVIEDLLLLSRLDAGRLAVEMQPVDLGLVIDSLLDDLSILPQNEQHPVEVEGEGNFWVRGNRGYTSLILQSLLENATKYNRKGGRIRISLDREGSFVACRIGNNGKAISPGMQARIFERFHRGATGENVPGYGLGLNLARELARLHGGRLELVESREDWTEFVLLLQAERPPEEEGNPWT